MWDVLEENLPQLSSNGYVLGPLLGTDTWKLEDFEVSVESHKKKLST